MRDEIDEYRKRYGTSTPFNPTVGQRVDVGVAPTGYGSQYDQLFAANPYRNLTYNKSGWQSFLEGLGFRTKFDDFNEQAQINAAEYDAGIFSLMQQNQFNDPAAQAARMRNAGLNPDIQGIGDVAGAASPTEDPNGMNVAATDETEGLRLVSTVSSSLLGIIPKTMSFLTNLSQLKGIRLENDAKELSFGSAAVDAAAKFFLEGVTEQDYRDAFEKNDWANILDAAKKDSSYLSDTLFSSKGARKRFNLAYGMHSRSLLAKMQQYKTYDEFEKDRKSLLTQHASPFYSPDDEAMESLLSSIVGPTERWQQKMAEINLRKANLRNPEAEQRLQNMQIANQTEYEAAIDAAGQASAENAANEAQQQQNEIMQATNQLFADIMDSLKKNDNWWSKIAMALVGIARAQLLSGLSLQFGRKSQYSVDGDTGVMTESGSSILSVGN